MITDFIIAVICGVSAANIITEEYVFEWLRKLVRKTNIEWMITLFHCLTCMSFWTGLCSGLIVMGLSPYVIAVALCSSIVGKLIKMREE